MFHNCTNKEDVKKLFRRIAKHLHPDSGGEHDLMILLQESYQISFDFYENLEKLEKEEETKRRQEEERKRKQQVKAYEKTEEDVHEEDQRLEIIDKIRRYSENHKKFKLDFVESIEETLENRGYITSGQFNALVKIFYNFRMDIEE